MKLPIYIQFTTQSAPTLNFSMPVVVRDSGMMWNKDDALEDVKCLIPDRCYARMYKTVMDDCRENGQFDVSTMGKLR